MKSNLLKIIEKELFGEETVSSTDMITLENTVEDMPLKIETDAENLVVCNKNFFNINAETIYMPTNSLKGELEVIETKATLKATDRIYSTISRRGWVIELPNLNDIYISAESCIIVGYNTGVYYRFTDEKPTTLENNDDNATLITNAINGGQIKITPTSKFLTIYMKAQYVEKSGTTGLSEERTTTVNKLMVSYSDNITYVKHEQEQNITQSNLNKAVSYDNITHIYSTDETSANITATAKTSKIKKLETLSELAESEA